MAGGESKPHMPPAIYHLPPSPIRGVRPGGRVLAAKFDLHQVAVAFDFDALRVARTVEAGDRAVEFDLDFLVARPSEQVLLARLLELDRARGIGLQGVGRRAALADPDAVERFAGLGIDHAEESACRRSRGRAAGARRGTRAAQVSRLNGGSLRRSSVSPHP